MPSELHDLLQRNLDAGDRLPDADTTWDAGRRRRHRRLVARLVVATVGVIVGVVVAVPALSPSPRPAIVDQPEMVPSTADATPSAPAGSAEPSEPPVVERGCGWPASVAAHPADTRTTALHSAVLEGDIAAVDEQLRAGADPNAIDERLTATPLADAVHSNCIEIAEQLLAAGADPTLVAPGGIVPLTHAVNIGNPELIDLLLGAGADPSQWEGSAKTLSPLHEAIGTGRISLLPRLLEEASDVDIGATGGDPLASGEDVGVGSPVEFAADLGRVRAAELLIDAGATPTRTAIYRAVFSGHRDTTLMLIDAGAPTAAAPSGRTLQDVALEQGHTDVMEALDLSTTQS